MTKADTSIQIDDSIGFSHARFSFQPPMIQTSFSKRSLCNSGDFGTLTAVVMISALPIVKAFQSPYGDFGTPTLNCFFSKFSTFRFSPLTGILVRRLCLPVPAPRLGSQAIFSNLRLFSPFGLTRVKNKNQAMAIIGLVMPFIAVLKIFKPTGFLTLKTIFQRSVVL